MFPHSVLRKIQEGFLLLKVYADSPLAAGAKRLYKTDSRWMCFAQRFAMPEGAVGGQNRAGLCGLGSWTGLLAEGQLALKIEMGWDLNKCRRNCQAFLAWRNERVVRDEGILVEAEAGCGEGGAVAWEQQWVGSYGCWEGLKGIRGVWGQSALEGKGRHFHS